MIEIINGIKFIIKILLYKCKKLIECYRGGKMGFIYDVFIESFKIR